MTPPPDMFPKVADSQSHVCAVPMDLLRCETGFEDVLRERLFRQSSTQLRARVLGEAVFLSFVVCVCVCECVSQVSLWRV